MRGFPIGSPESRALARMRAKHIRDTRKRIEIISNVPRPPHSLPPGANNLIPYVGPWQETQDGTLLRFVYRPGEWKKLPVETIPVCSSCGTPFRKTGKELGDVAWFEADCMAKHISDDSNVSSQVEC
jgi:hypothetical protein